MAGSLGDLGGLLRQAQQMQRQAAELQEELQRRSFQGSSGGGAVRVTVSGAKQVLEIKINPQAVDPDDVEILEDLVATAVNDALRQAEETIQDEMKRLTGGLGLPGIL